MALYSNIAPKQKNKSIRRRIPYANGLYGKRYAGYFGSLSDAALDDVNWFDTASLYLGVNTNQLTTFNRFSSNDNNYSWQWLGYFRARTSENYTFYTASDDASYLWIGDSAKFGFTKENSIVNNGGPHAVQERSGSISLVAGIYYPIRIQFGEAGGGDEVSVSFTTPSISRLNNGVTYYSDGLGFFYYNSASNSF
jgi:hypothetical protein